MPAPGDSFQFDFPPGVTQAADHVTSLAVLLPDQGNHFPNDPTLPPNPVFELPTASSVIATLFGDGIITEGLHQHDWLL